MKNITNNIVRKITLVVAGSLLLSTPALASTVVLTPSTLNTTLGQNLTVTVGSRADTDCRYA